jgi:hypothetical protein
MDENTKAMVSSALSTTHCSITSTGSFSKVDFLTIDFPFPVPKVGDGEVSSSRGLSPAIRLFESSACCTSTARFTASTEDSPESPPILTNHTGKI